MNFVSSPTSQAVFASWFWQALREQRSGVAAPATLSQGKSCARPSDSGPASLCCKDVLLRFLSGVFAWASPNSAVGLNSLNLWVTNYHVHNNSQCILLRTR